MAFVQFISESYLKANTVIDTNVDMRLLNPTLRLVQEKYVLPILGTALYNKLKTDVQATSLAGNYKTLMDDYILPCLMWYVLYEAPVPLSYRLTNKDVVRKTSDNSQAAPLNELQYAMDKARDNAEYYAMKIYKYLNANPTLFTEYTSPGTASDTVYPTSRTFTNPIYLSDKGNQKSALNYLKDEGVDGN